MTNIGKAQKLPILIILLIMKSHAQGIAVSHVPAPDVQASGGYCK